MQLTDPHIVAPGESYHGSDTARYLSEALAFVATLRPVPDYIIVTGDLVNAGEPSEYARFVGLMATTALPWFALMGNHDERGPFRGGLPPRTYGAARTERIRFVIDDFPLRTVVLDANEPRRRRWPAASLDPESLAWLETTLAAAPARPTLIAIHQPPFRTGLHYFDVFGYAGARRLRSIILEAPQVGRVICGHIHCVKTFALGTALIASAPSTAPQVVPEFFERHILGLRHESPGFAVHDWSAGGGFRSTVYRRTSGASFAADAPLALATRR